MSGSLTCSASTCVHNTGGLCSANKIEIMGKVASSSKGTNCNTFANRGIKNALTNMANMNIQGEVKQLFSKDTIMMSPVISCSAKNCAHNLEGRCNAREVDIIGYDAVSRENTECETFI